MAKQQLLVDNSKIVHGKGSKDVKMDLTFGAYADEAARYGVLDIEGLFEKKKPFKIIKDTVAELGMKTKVRDDCWKQIPEVLKSELFDAVLAITELPEKEIESLGFTLLLPGMDWKNEPVAKPKK